MKLQKKLKKGNNMKTLILLLSLILILSSGCGEEDSPDIRPPLNTDDTDSKRNDVVQTPAPAGRSTPPATKPASPCDAYTQACTGDVECGAKYHNCLEPKAGAPATTEITVCTKEQDSITLTLHEWTHLAGANKLLCSFFEKEELYQFATNVKSTCKNNLNSRQEELEKSGYSCTKK